MESSKLINQIEFKFLRNSYPLNEKVLCYFNTQTGVHVPQVGDWVGLFKVGWKNTKEHKSRKYVSIEDIENARRANVDYGYVVFEQHEVPKDLEGYYQFVYVTKDETVRGASKPFQFEMEPRELRDELKEMKREMWSTLERPSWKNVEEREMWRKVEEKEREQREREREREFRGIRENEREQLRERERELREIRESEREQQRELRELRERQIREIEHEQQLKSKLRHDLNNNSKLVDVIETELEESLPLSRSVWEKMSEDNIVNKLVHKYLTSLSGPSSTSSKPSKKEEIVRKLEELSHSLKSRVSEISDLKRECQELRLINNELSGKLTSGEKKVETLERELERESRKRFDEETIPSIMEKSGKHFFNVAGTEMSESKELLKEENERLREELRRLTVLYQTESSQYSTLKDRLMKIDETLLRQISKRLSSEKSLSELEETTLVEVKGLKKLIDELRCENEVLKARIRQDERKPEVVLQYPVSSKSSSVIVKEKSTTHIPKVSSQPEYLSLIETTTTTTRPTSVVETVGYPSISVSTSIPEISSKLTVSGKVSTVPELLFLEQVKKQTEQLRNKSIEEQLLRRQVQQIEEQLRSKSSEEQWKNKMVEEQLKIKLDKVVSGGKHSSEKREREEILREMTSEKERVEVPSKYSSLWVLSSQPQPHQPSTISSMSSLPSVVVSEELKRHQQKQLLKQYEEQAKQQLKEQITVTQVSSICPVCGIVVPKELNQTEFELHVNSHFRD